MTIYEQRGFECRTDYLLSLAESYSVDSNVVLDLAILLGPREDFSGLVEMVKETAEYVDWNDDLEHDLLVQHMEEHDNPPDAGEF